MQTVNYSETSETIEGTFVKELKNRFLCEVLINDELTVCYVPSSCHLSHFLDLSGKKVVLKKNATSGSRTEYALAAIPYKRNYIVLNTSAANIAFENSIHSRLFSKLGKRNDYKHEFTIQGYKCDFYLPQSKSIIEIKSILSLDSHASFPTVYSQRTSIQLKKLLALLRQGYHAYFFIISLHPYLEEVHIQSGIEFYELIKECIEEGLSVQAYTIRTKEKQYSLDKSIPVIME